MEREIKENGSGKGKEVLRIKPGSEYGIANRIEQRRAIREEEHRSRNWESDGFVRGEVKLRNSG